MLTTLYDLPELEVLDGRRVPKVSPRRTHALVQRALLAVLERCAADRGEFGPEWRFELGAVDGTDTALVPDIAFVSTERLRALSDDEAEEPPLAPDIVVEIRSPASRPAFLRRKIERYLRTGSSLVLDVDPARKTITGHSPGGVRTFHAGEQFAHAAVPWLEFEIAGIFPKPRTP